MYSKLFFNILLAFLASNPRRIIFAQDDAEHKLKELIKNPGWSLMENEKILDNGKEITMLELIKDFDDENIIAERPNKPLIRHLTIMLCCKQSKFIRKYIILFLSLLSQCRQQVDFPMNYTNCFYWLLKNIQNIDFTVTRMLNILTYFYQLSTVTTDFKPLYNALMTLKLYSEYKSKTEMQSTFNEDKDKPDKMKIEMNFREFERIYFLIDLQVQTFAVMYCLPTNQPLRQINIDVQYEKHIGMLRYTEDYGKSHTNENYSEPITNLVNKFNEECFVALGFEHLDLYDINAINIDLQHIWKLLEQQQPSDHKIRIHWSSEPKEVTAVVQEVTSQYSTKKLAAFQKSSLKSITQMFYKKLIVTVQTTFSEINNKFDEGLCPPNFFTVLRNNWVELKSRYYPAIREACVSIRNSVSKEDCQESFYKSLKRGSKKFNSIKKPAISAACIAVAISSTKQNVPLFTEWLSILVESIFSLLYRPPETIANGLVSTKKVFWVDFKNELVKFLSVDWPTETIETLKTLIFYLEMEHIVDPEDIIKLLELEMKAASADFVDNEETLREIDSVKRLEILRKFTDDVVMLRKSINNVRLNNALLLNASDFEESKLIKPTKEFDDKAQQEICNLSTKIIGILNFLKKYLGLYNQPNKSLINLIINRLGLVNEKLNGRLLPIVHFLLLQMLKVPKAENVNLRNAVVLMLMFDTKLINPDDKDIIGVRWRLSQFEKITILIINQIDYYVVKNCGILKCNKRIIKDTKLDSFNVFKNTHWKMINDIDNVIREMKDIPLIVDECKINISLGYYDTLVNGEKDELNPLKCMVELKFQWDGTLQSIQYIQKEVESSISPKKFAIYQNLVQNSVTSIFLGYILNILQTVGQDEVNFTDDQIASILLKVEQFDSIVYPSSKVDSPSHIFNVFVWCFEQNKISHTKATILKDKIKRKIESYDINMTDYYNVLKSNNIISEYASDDVQKTYIAPLEEFVDHWVAMFKQDFHCVGNYMKLIL